MSFYKKLIHNLPEVNLPEGKLPLKKKLYWTVGMLVMFYVLSLIPLYGISSQQASYFETMELLLGASFGNLLTLGIGPIVTASIVLQLLMGAGILNFDTSTEEGKATYTGTYKLLAYLFIIFEAFVYVKMGAITPQDPSFFWVVFLQLVLGGFIVLHMDEVVKNWGLGSGISLFIAAGVAQAVFVQTLSPLTKAGTLAFPFVDKAPVGKLFAALFFLSHQNFTGFLYTALLPIVITAGLFLVITYFQSINVEIPLSFGRIRGHSVKWPLNFFYTSNIPVILIAALGANFRLWAKLLQNAAESTGNSVLNFISVYILGQIQGNTPVSGLVNWIQRVDLWANLSNLSYVLPHMLTYALFMVAGSVVFSIFWMQTSGMDPKSQAKNIISSGLQIPGFRKDKRVIEKLLSKYILPLTVMGGIAVGLLAAFADTLGALSSGTGLLLLIMIIYQFYQMLARESMDDVAMLQRFFNK